MRRKKQLWVSKGRKGNSREAKLASPVLLKISRDGHSLLIKIPKPTETSNL